MNVKGKSTPRGKAGKPPTPSNIIALLSDFGLKDHYVGVMKGVILSINPYARVVDISHEIEARNIFAGCFLLENSYRYFPPGTVFAAIVDPGVGTGRRIVAARANRKIFIAPDNGLLSFLKDTDCLVEVRNSAFFLKPVSNTFHGRDIVAPVAAHLSSGVALSEVGPQIRSMVRLPHAPAKELRFGELVGRVNYVDRFGNLMIDISEDQLSPAKNIRIEIGRRRILGLTRTYADALNGGLIATVGSSRMLEIALPNGSAARETGAKVGDKVWVTLR